MLALVLRNLFQNITARLPQATMVAGTLAVLLIGNCLLESSRQGLRDTYVNAFTGDWSVSGVSTDAFTLFGTDLPLIGEYVVTPALPAPEQWRPVLDRYSSDISYLPQVSASAAVLFPDGRNQSTPVFGVEFPKYFDFFPSLNLTSGTLTPKNPRAVLLNRARFLEVSRQLGRELRLGDLLDLGITINGSFVIRQVEFSGTYEYSGTDPLLDRAILVDPTTARALNGYTVGSLSREAVDPETSGLLDLDLEELFSESRDQAADMDNGLDLVSTEKTLSQTTVRDSTNETLEGAWNFLLIRAIRPDGGGLGSRLQADFDSAGLSIQVRDWVATAGGNALVVSFLQLAFSIGLSLVALVASMIVMNSLALSVSERTQEIGTMRALGASRGFVASLIALETCLVVLGSAVVGLLLGSLFLGAIGQAGVSLSNPVLASWLGSSTLRPVLSFPLLVGHFLLALGLAGASCTLPVYRALAITAREAMLRES